MISKKIIILAAITASAFTCNTQADQRLTLGVKLLGAGWEGDNGSAGNDFNSSNGGQFGFNISYKADKFYSGLSLQGGEYKFSGNAPDQFTTSGRVASSNVDIKQSDFDLVFGYYFWPKVSLFLDFKAVGNEWQHDNYKQSFGGLGLGATTYLPLNDNWTLFGSFGLIGRGDVKDDDKNKVGDGSSSALEIGAVYRLNENSHINMGLKFRKYNLEYLDDSNLKYTLNAIFVGYNYAFVLD